MSTSVDARTYDRAGRAASSSPSGAGQIAAKATPFLERVLPWPERDGFSGYANLHWRNVDKPPARQWVSRERYTNGLRATIGG
jgi:hypothetical protein